MTRKLRFLLSALGLASMIPAANAQLGSPLFSLPYDTVCKESEFVPTLLATNAQTYKWSFCNPRFEFAPQSNDMGAGNFALNVNNNLHTVKAGDQFYSFSVSSIGRMYRYQYINGIESNPNTIDLGNFSNAVPTTPQGTFAIENEAGWHVFSIGTSGGVSKLIRVDFASGLNYPPSGTTTYNISGQFANPRELFMVLVNDTVRAFTFDNNKLKRIDFSRDLNSIAHVEDFGTMGDVFQTVSGIAPVKELNNYHLMVTNEASSTISHITFGNSWLNKPFAVNLGDINSKIDVPSGISVVRSCNDYYGFVTNKNNAEWAVLHWTASIAGTPTAAIFDLGSNLLLPTVLSNPQSFEGAIYMHVVNSNNAFTRVKYAPCGVSSVSGSDQANPPSIKYSQTGTYSISLLVDEGMPTEQAYCYPITVVEFPSINLTTQDTLICSGDTINMHALTFGTDSLTWGPDYNITPLKGNFVKVWPEYSQIYYVIFNFAPNCIVRKDFNIQVDNIVADAGSDRDITDGSPTTLGGPNTSLRSGLSYAWTPDVYFQSSRLEPVAQVRPAQNMTYYLTVTSPTGCSAIDSVHIGVPCESINLPNAFEPRSSTFGLLNLQLTQVNYLRIYDRWGKLVFSTTDPGTQWNGRNLKGVECEVGVYVWEIDAFCKDTNKRFRTTGNVTLIR